jgi:hypothetical protein
MWPANYDKNDIEHVQGLHVKAPRRDCGHCAWFYAPAPRVTPKTPQE